MKRLKQNLDQSADYSELFLPQIDTLKKTTRQSSLLTTCLLERFGRLQNISLWLKQKTVYIASLENAKQWYRVFQKSVPEPSSSRVPRNILKYLSIYRVHKKIFILCFNFITNINTYNTYLIIFLSNFYKHHFECT